MKLLNLIKGTIAAVVALACAGVALPSCNLVYDDQADCPEPIIDYSEDPGADSELLGDNRLIRMRFTYKYNLKFADAFPAEVGSVTVYAYDKSGNLVTGFPIMDSGTALDKEGYYLDITIPPGTYDFYCWGGTVGNEMFTMKDVSTTGTFTAGVPDVISKTSYTIDERIPGVYYGAVEDYTIGETYTTYYIDMDLMKDTNTIRIMLEDLSGETLSEDKFLVYLESGDNENGIVGNAVMNYDNSLDESYIGNITYNPWGQYMGTVTVETKTETESSMLVSEFTSLRLMEDSPLSLYIYNKENGELVLKVPVVDLALILKGLERKDMADQEYLDRQDEYNFTFFLTGGEKWMSAYIYVNSWKVVLSDVDF